MAVLPVGISGEEAGYQIERSLRFNSADSAYLNRTPGSTTDRQKWTWSGWIKRTSLLNANYQTIFAADSGTNPDRLYFGRSGTSDYLLAASLADTYVLVTTQVFRDPGSWFHLVWAVDTTQATNTDRAKLYVNGVQITAFNSSSYPTLNYNTQFNLSGRPNYIGGRGASNLLDGYLTEINFIDGSALDPTSFGEYNSDTGVWQPKAYAGSYGTNGFYLNFSDNASTAALGTDYSGNSNTWTVNGISITAGVNNDSLVDTPTPYGTDTGVGGEVRGNYATLNPLDIYATAPTNGNLDYASSNGKSRSTIAIPTSGKWYWEVRANASRLYTGVIKTSTVFSTSTVITSNAGSGYYTLERQSTINNFYNASTSATSLGSATLTSGDVMAFAYDADTRKFWIGYGNGSGSATWYSSGDPAGGTNELATLVDTEYSAFCYDNSSLYSSSWNFGQRPFAYTAPSGFKALCTQNLPEPTIVDGSQYFAPVIWDGDGTSPRTIAVGFQPDLTWVKQRNQAYSVGHQLYDVVRGLGTDKELNTSSTNAEGAGNTEVYGYLSGFTSTGFTGTAGTSGTDYVNLSGVKYVAWNWKANGAGVSNTDGTITSTVSANTDSGFSIVTYTGNATSGATVGHGLAVKPAMIIGKNRSGAAQNWQVWHQSMGDNVMQLNSTAAQVASTSNSVFLVSGINSTVFQLGTNPSINGSSTTQVAYCFAAIPAYSAFGSYINNSSADGPFVYLGFLPRFVMIKYITAGTTDWMMYDSARNEYNVVNYYLRANLSNAEGTKSWIDFLSNGFKVRNTDTTSASINFTSGTGTFIYAAFAENPFKYSLAR